MNYYEVVLLKSPLNRLTYSSSQDIELFTKVLIPLRGRKTSTEAVVIKKVPKPEYNCKDIEKITQYYYSQQNIETAKFISQYYVCSLGEALSVFTPFDKRLILEEQNIEINDDITLSSNQEQALEFCNKNKTALLFANTGSGKTEVYIKLIKQTILDNKQAILLMPEISLTPQMEKRLQKVFGSAIALWHSKITKKKKEAILEGIQSGSIKLIAGARSALFLPLKDLGLIIVDEEHDESYKSDQKPRYHAKDLSIYLGSNYNIQVVLGSATPSITSFNKIPYIRIKEKFFNSTTNNIYFDESDLKLSDPILLKIKQTIDHKKQVIIFLPTRANYKYQVCSDCGKAVECPYCSVSMSLYSESRALKCHYCNYTQRIPQNCPSCHTGIIKNSRLGTAEVVSQLKEMFNDTKIEQFDRDKVKTDKQLRTILKNFNDGDIDILVGTQMLSKGHDYHNVSLAVVLGIDSVLNMESYKSREKALSLCLQIAGRSGRKENGEVIVQTQNKEFFDYYLNETDYEDFLSEELNFRSILYPPKVRLAKVIFSHQNGIKAQEEMIHFKELAQKYDIQVIGFGPSVVSKIANKYRFEIFVRSQKVKPLLQYLHSIDSTIASIDMDTLS
jgi:primosomal protein N' (replication factor Y)